MPHSRFLIQTQRYDFNELVRSSILPYFATDNTMRFSDLGEDRVAVAIKDEEAAVTYYIVYLRSEQESFRELLGE